VGFVSTETPNFLLSLYWGSKLKLKLLL